MVAMWRSTSAAALVCLWTASTAYGPPLPTMSLDRLIEQLGHPEIAQREAAQKALRSLGDDAMAKLKEAATLHVNPEVRRRATIVMHAIDSGELLVMTGGAGYWLNRVLFTPDGKQAVATGGAVILYDLDTGKETKRYLELQFA